MKRLNGKVAFITGVARGQGRAHALRLAADGADIIGVDLAGPLPGVPYSSPSLDDLDETRRLVEKEGRKAHLFQCDVRDSNEMRKIVDRAVESLGRLDIVVANAGICIPATWDQTTEQSFRDHMDINVTGVWNTVMVAAPHLLDRGGSVVLVSSLAGKKVQPFMVPYAASKHAVTGMTRAFAAELGRHNIRVNSVHPGAVDTPMGSGDMVATLERATESNPALGRMGAVFLNQYAAAAEQISDAVAFLVSDEASFITAEHLSIDGGAQFY